MFNAIPRILLAALLMVPPLCAVDPKCNAGTLPVVTIYINEKINLALYERARAIFVATRAFREIGVQLTWREGSVSQEPESPACNPAGVIELQVDQAADASEPPDVLAYATPASNSGARIHVFHDRVAGFSAQVPNLLGYVLAHEIAHVLQGIARHSDDGILKARWIGRDYNRMGTFSLSFSREDAEIIGFHLGRRHGVTE